MDGSDKPDFIPCSTFVRRGVSKPKPELVKATKEELQEIIKEMKLKEAEYNSRPKEVGDTEMREDGSGRDSDAEIDDYYDMDNYDDEPTDTATSIPIENLILHNTEDSDENSDDNHDSEDEEKDEFAVQPTDNLILIGHVDDDVCMLEVYVFNNDNAELFIQHDIFLPSYPVAIEWMDFNPKDSENCGHFAAIGSMTPQIDVWDLNVTGCLEPAYSLGTKKAKGLKHKDAVLDLAWNTINRNVLASGSADHTVLLWNLADQKSLMKLSVFEEKVQSIKWHPVESQNLLTGSCDGKVRLFDCRSSSTFKTWVFDGEIEKVLWNKFDPLYFFVTNDKGMVHYVDVRNPKPIWNLKAHDKEATSIALSSHCQDLLVTGSMDETVKVWDLKDQKPQLVTTKSMNIGSIYTISSCPDVPYVFCAGGTRRDNNMYVWDIRENDAIMERFKDRRLEEAYIAHVSGDPQGDNSAMDDEPAATTSSSTSGLRSIGNIKDGRIQKKKKKNRLVDTLRNGEEGSETATATGADAGAGEGQPGPSSGSASNQQSKKRNKN